MKTRCLKLLSPLVVPVLLASLSSYAYAEAPAGQTTAKIFADVHSTTEDESAGSDKKKNSSAFDVTRAYFGYKHSFSDQLSMKLVLDVERANEVTSVDLTQTPPVINGFDTRYEAFLKLGYVEWKDFAPTMSMKFGLHDLNQFGIQENFWGYRYIFKSLMDESKFGTSADLGLALTTKPHEIVSVTLSVLNGEGYKSPQDSDSKYKTTLGLLLKPMSETTLYFYYDQMPVAGTDTKAQTNLAGFIGFSLTDLFRIGVEYDLHNNNKGVKDRHLTGISTYATYNVMAPFEVFARFDSLTSKSDWNIKKDGSTLIAGLQYAPVKGVKFSPNFQLFTPKDSDKGIKKQSLYLSSEFAF